MDEATKPSSDDGKQPVKEAHRHLSPQEFYQEIMRRPDIREIMKRLAAS
ncbi:MAG: hypothetical protein ACR2PL_11880 [Dehalococcoidia bacterium]